jgi:hypothetical protein
MEIIDKYRILGFFLMLLNIPSAHAGDSFAAPDPDADFNKFQNQHEDTTPLVNMEFAISDGLSKGDRQMEQGMEAFNEISNGENYVNSIYIAPNSTVKGDIILIQKSDTFVYSK